jgi:hypothetical protein
MSDRGFFGNALYLDFHMIAIQICLKKNITRVEIFPLAQSHDFYFFWVIKKLFKLSTHGLML